MLSDHWIQYLQHFCQAERLCLAFALCRTAEHTRLEDDTWRQWGPYLSERHWGTVREDHSRDGNWFVLLLFVSAFVMRMSRFGDDDDDDDDGDDFFPLCKIKG